MKLKEKKSKLNNNDDLSLKEENTLDKTSIFKAKISVNQIESKHEYLIEINTITISLEKTNNDDILRNSYLLNYKELVCVGKSKGLINIIYPNADSHFTSNISNTNSQYKEQGSDETLIINIYI